MKYNTLLKIKAVVSNFFCLVTLNNTFIKKLVFSWCSLSPYRCCYELHLEDFPI